MAAAIKPIKTYRSLADLRRSVRIAEAKKEKKLRAWRIAAKKWQRTDPRRKKAWAAYRLADRKLREAKGKLLWKERQKPKVTKRQRCVEHACVYAGKVKESPPGSNRGGLITTWERRLGAYLVGQPWCGTFAANMLLAVGVRGVSARLASVALIEDDARAKRGCFASWSANSRGVRPGDLVVLFGRGVHVGIVVRVDVGQGVAYTVEGNTSSGSWGSQSNGGGVYRRTRRLRDVHGFALVKFPE